MAKLQRLPCLLQSVKDFNVITIEHNVAGLSRYESQSSPAAVEQQAYYLSRFSFVRFYIAVLSYTQLMQPLNVKPGQC